MAKKDSERKWLVILIVLIAISLVVDLVSLNVLYKVSNTANPGTSSGKLASANVRAIDPCSKCEKNLQKCIRNCGKNPTQECILTCNAKYDLCMNDNNCI